MKKILLHAGIHSWLVELAFSAFNFYVLMNLVYLPAWGMLAAHQVGMSTRIVSIPVISLLLLRRVKAHGKRDLLHLGLLWLGPELSFDWGNERR